MITVVFSAMDLSPDDAGACVMIGTNLERDIAGAKALGIRTIWIDWRAARFLVGRRGALA